MITYQIRRIQEGTSTSVLQTSLAYTGIDDFEIFFLRMRDLTASQLGRLIKVRAQVVRAHPIHPELLMGTFRCSECKIVIRNVEQPFKYTQVLPRLTNLVSQRYVLILNAGTDWSLSCLRMSRSSSISRKSEFKKLSLNYLEGAFHASKLILLTFVFFVCLFTSPKKYKHCG